MKVDPQSRQLDYRLSANASQRKMISSVLAVGTLVLMVPTKDGLVVAADSRVTTATVFHDTAYKIVPLAKPERAILTGTGNTTAHDFKNTPPLPRLLTS